jgi:hypothetical protein
MLRGRFILVLVLLSLMVIVLCVPRPACAVGVIDQSYTASPIGYSWINGHMPIGQSFRPTKSSLLGVDVGIENVLVTDQSYTPGFGVATYNWINPHSPIGESFTPSLPILGAVDVGIYNVETLDQNNDPGFGAVGWNWVQAHQPIGQSFTPIYPQLWRVDLGLDLPIGSSVSLTLNIRQDTITGSIIATQNFTVPVGGPAWVPVYFTPYPGVSLTPGNTYVLDLVGTGVSSVRWYQQTPATYPGGNAITDGNPQSTADYLFKTYGFGNSITMSIHSGTIGGAVVASKTLPIPPMDLPIMMKFTLDTPIMVTIGSTYVIELQQTPESVRWYLVNPAGSYLDGTAITNGSADPFGDYLFSTYGAGTNLIVNVRDGSIGGSLLGSVTGAVPVTAPTLFHVDFPAPIAVTPGDTFVIQLQQNDAQSMRWDLVNPGGGYLNGTAITDGIPNPSADYLFQTYTEAGPTATSLSIDFAPPTINITSSPPEAGTITATISPATPGLPVSIYYATDPAGNWTLITTGNTDGAGKLTVNWTPPANGIYYFQATFSGDASHLASSKTSIPNSMTAVAEFPMITLTLVLSIGLFKVLVRLKKTRR